MKEQMEAERWILKKQKLLEVHLRPLSQGRNISKRARTKSGKTNLESMVKADVKIIFETYFRTCGRLNSSFPPKMSMLQSLEFVNMFSCMQNGIL